MSLPFDVQQFPFKFGLSEGIDPYQAESGTLTVAENVEWMKTGLLQKRLGADGLGTDIFGGGSIGAIDVGRLFVRRGELCLIDGSYLYAWSPAESKWFRIDRVPDASMTWKTVLDINEGVAFHDSAITAGGLIIHTWASADPLTYLETSHALFLRIDDSDGETVMVPTQLQGTSVGCVKILVDDGNSRAFIVWGNAFSGNIKIVSLDLTTFTLGTQRTISGAAWRNVFTNAAGGALDAFMDVAAGNIYVAYESTAPAIEVKRVTYNSGPDTYTVAATGNTNTSGSDLRCISIDGLAGEVLYVAFGDRTGNRTRILTMDPATLAVVTAVTDLVTAAGCTNIQVKRADAANALVIWTWTDTSTTESRVMSVKVSSVLAQDATTWRGTAGTRLISKMFLVGTRYFAFMVSAAIPSGGTQTSNYQGSDSYLVEVETSDTSAYTSGTTKLVPHRYLGRVDLLIGGLSRQGCLANACVISSTEARIAVPFLSTVPQARVNWRCGLRMVTLKIGKNLGLDMWRTVEYGGEAYISGGLFSAYDGRKVFDYGFPDAIGIGSVTTASPGGTSLTAGTYLLAMHLEHRSNAGIAHRGRVSTWTTPALGAGDQYTFNWRGVSLTCKNDKSVGFGFALTYADAAPLPLARLHRTTANGTTYYSYTFEPNDNVYQYDFLIITQATISPTAPDSNIGDSVVLSTRPAVYTDGGILDDEQPPSNGSVCLHRNRMWIISGDLRTVWFTKSFDDDTGFAPGFSTSFRLLFNKDITALGSLDDKLIIFAEDAIWFVAGDGPAPDGNDSDFTQATQIQTDVGCSQPRSVVSTPMGLMFANDDGIYLLTRGLEVQFIGREVQDTFDDFPVITSGVLLHERNQVRFTCNDDVAGSATAGIVIVYDYQVEQWATRTYDASAFASAVKWGSQWVAVTTDGYVLMEKREEDAAAYLDDGAFVESTLETAWISRSGPSAYQRIRRAHMLGRRITDADVNVYIKVDGDDSIVETRQWLSDELSSSAGGRVGIHLQHQKSHAIKVRAKDSAPTGVGATLGNGQGFMWSMLGLELANKKGLEKRAEGAKK